MMLHRRTVLTGLLAAPVLSRSAHSAPVAPQLPRPALQPRWQRFAAATPPADGRPAISIVIDDLGVIHPGTARAVALPGPVTLAWFPFARDLAEKIGVATERGHETLLHMPMQAFGKSIAWTGPDPLRIDLPPEENLRRLVAAIDAVPDTVGLNNHMGSVATRDMALMDLVAQEVRRRDMLLLDSLTINHSVAYHCAVQAGVPATSRDVFLDNTADTALILDQLQHTENIARRIGHVVAIGHPRRHTLDALEAWLPGLEAKGFVLWPLSATVAWRNEIPMPGGTAV
jgi:polysaccharide deacetylase 2 family uncharacterized protein YibQ